MCKTGTPIQLVVLTHNPGANWETWVHGCRQQTSVVKTLVIDSSSSDKCVAIAEKAGFQVYVIPETEFDHGGTRQLAVEMCEEAEILVFCTQDAIFADNDALAHLLPPFDDPTVGAVCGW